MSLQLATPPNHALPDHESQHWNEGRLVVRTAGPDAGAMRLDIDLPDFETVDEVVHHVRLMIPGEASPLSPFDAEGECGRFVISFFSADISNAGHLPAAATVGLSGLGSQLRVKSVPIECAADVAEEDPGTAAEVDLPLTRMAYPRTVLLAVSGGLLALTLTMLAFLIL